MVINSCQFLFPLDWVSLNNTEPEIISLTFRFYAIDQHIENHCSAFLSLRKMQMSISDDQNSTI